MSDRPPEIREYVTKAAHADVRLDHFLAEKIPEIRRNQIQRLIREGQATLDGKVVEKPGAKLKPGAAVTLSIPRPQPYDVPPEDIPLDILHQDTDLAVINKPSGLSVHPTPFQMEGTLVNALLHHLDHLSGVGGILRPGIVHRLDRGTSGILVVAKNDAAHSALSEQFAARTIEKEYLALVQGRPKAEAGEVDAPISRHPQNRKIMAVVEGGRESLTRWEVEEHFADHTLLRARPKTGRTHQIRVHVKTLGCPIVGDRAYGYRMRTPLDKQIAALLRDHDGFCLHARRLTFRHPSTGETLTFEAPLPEIYEGILERLREEG